MSGAAPLAKPSIEFALVCFVSNQDENEE